ncbi:hypothetical protein [Kitasatospora brasiliensis]|uniref:hypothetical protein n=1 Tax=Kitasatospora brasiliensis TaxID=3058040 RepID=UPI00292FA8CA|nr:hypothetical protein [Kitasatospora sp. K002]
MNLRDRCAFLGRTVHSLMREPRVTWSWIWGAYLQFTPPVLWFSPGRRQAVARANRVRDDERHAHEALAEAVRDAILAQVEEAKAHAQRAAALYDLVHEVIPAPPRRPRVARPPNRRN